MVSLDSGFNWKKAIDNVQQASWDRSLSSSILNTQSRIIIAHFDLNEINGKSKQASRRYNY